MSTPTTMTNPGNPPAAGPSASPQQPAPHARLLSMIQGLAVGLGSAGKAIATGGREGGVPEVQAYQENQQAMALKEQANQRAQQQAQQELAESKGRLTYNRALTNHMILQDQINLQKAPDEIALAHTQNQKAMLDLYKEAGLSPMAAIMMIQGQDPQIHMQAVNSAANGDLVNHTAIPVHDDKPGEGGTTNLFSSNAMAQLTFAKDKLAPVLAQEKNMLDVTASRLGADAPEVKQAKAMLEQAQSAPSMNGEDFFRHNVAFQNLLSVAVAKKEAMLQSQKEQADVTRAQQEADPILKLQGDLGKPETAAKIQAAIADPRTKPEDVPRLNALIPKQQLAIQADLNMKSREKENEQAITQGDPATAGALLANRSLTLPDLKSRSVTPQFIASAIKAAQKIDPNFKAPEAEAQAKIAGAPANQQFFGNTDSLLVKGGTLDQLQQRASALPNGQIPVFNKVADLVSAETGQGPIAAFAAAALGVADDYAKVMGVGSDTARAQVLGILKASQSPEQFLAGISQIRQQVASQREGRIGSNPYLKDMYPDPQAGGAPPAGSQPVYLNGKLIGHTTDGKTMVPAQ